MNRDKVEKVDAYIERKKGKMRIHLNSLTIDLVIEDDNPGPLGHKNGQDPGVIFWKSNYIKKHENFFEHGTQRPLAHEKIPQRQVQNICESINKEEGEASK